MPPPARRCSARRCSCAAAGSAAWAASPPARRRPTTTPASSSTRSRSTPRSCNTEWLGKKFNIIDTPGYADFISEGIGALRVGRLRARRHQRRARPRASAPTPSGTTRRTTACRRSSRSTRSTSRTPISTPCLPGAREHFGKNVFPMTIPLDAGPGFSRVLDVLRNEVVTYKPGGNGRYKEEPADGRAGRARARAAPPADGIRRRVRRRAHGEVLRRRASSARRSSARACTRRSRTRCSSPSSPCRRSATSGVARLMDFIAKYGSSPEDRADVPARDAERASRHGVALPARARRLRVQDDERAGRRRAVPLPGLLGERPQRRGALQPDPAGERAPRASSTS